MEPAKPQRTAPPVTAAQILASRNQELARLASREEAKTSVFGSRPRRKAISSSTREYKYATYLESWRRKVEQVGNLNYPDEARRKHLYGNLILRVAVRADGSVEQIQVLRLLRLSRPGPGRHPHRRAVCPLRPLSGGHQGRHRRP